LENENSQCKKLHLLKTFLSDSSVMDSVSGLIKMDWWTGKILILCYQINNKLFLINFYVKGAGQWNFWISALKSLVKLLEKWPKVSKNSHKIAK
jgi:hypothetical protein